MSSLPRKKTAYGLYVNTNLPFKMAEGEGLYNYKEAAQLVGLKPTGNFRRRVQALVATGIINVTSCFTPANGIETRFSVTKEHLEEIPF